MILGFNEYFNELLLEAKSPEEVVRILSYKHPEIPESLIKGVVEADPTKKKSYSAWVFNVEKDPVKINSYLKSGKLRKIFDYFRENIKEGASLMDKETLEDALGCLSDFNQLFAFDKENPDANDYDIKIETPEWIVAVPNTYEASKKLGKDTKWCTADAYGNGLAYWNEYTSRGPLWINFDKRKKETLAGTTYPFKRYQFSFEKKAYLDALDNPFNWEDIEMPEEVQDMYKEQGYDLTDLMMSDEERWEAYNQARFDDSVWVFEDLYLMREWDNDLQWDANEDDPDYYLYDSNDDTDPLVNSATYTQESVIFSDDSLKYAILKEKTYYDNAPESFTLAIQQHESNRYGTGINLYSGLDNYTLLGKNGERYVAYIDDKDNSLVYVAYEGLFNVKDYSSAKNISLGAKIFVNEAMSNDDAVMYIEVVDNGEHSLYRVDFVDIELVEIISDDIPANGKYFEVGQNGKIQGKYGTYSPTGEYDDDEDVGYMPVKTLANKDLLLCKSQHGLFNVFSSTNMKERLFENDFELFLADLTDSNYNGIIVQTENNENGFGMKQLLSIAKRAPASDKYEYMQASNNKQVVIAAHGKLDNEGGTVPADGRYIITGHGDVPTSSARPFCINGKTPAYIKTEDGEEQFRVFDMETMQFGADWVVGNVQTLGYSLGSEEGRYVIAKDRKGTLHIYDWVSNKIIASGISSEKKPDTLRDASQKSCNEYLRVIKFNDGTVNLFNLRSGGMLLKERPTKIIGGKSYTSDTAYAMLAFNGGEKNYFIQIFRTGEGKKLLNGTPVLSSGHELYPTINGKFVIFVVDGDRNNKMFKLDLENGQIAYYGVDPETMHYDEIPIERAPEATKQIASKMFPWMTSTAQSLTERMNKINRPR